MQPEGRESWERHPRTPEHDEMPRASPAGKPVSTTPAPPAPPVVTPVPSPSSPSPTALDAHPAPPVAPQVTHPSPPQQTAPSAPPASPVKKPAFDVFQGEIIDMETHLSGLWEFKYKLDKPIHFIAGQYVSVIVPGIPKPSPFSIASSPEQHDVLDLGVEVVGKVTTAMAQMKPGDKVTLKGPFGSFVMGNERKVCYLAGGIGITPFMSMLRWIRDTHPDKRAVLFYSCRTRQQFMWLEELEQMQRDLPNVKIVLTITRDAPPEWTHRRGRIDEAMIREELPDYMEYVFYSCGPVPLIDGMFTLLQGMGVPPDKLKREPWH